MKHPDTTDHGQDYAATRFEVWPRHEDNPFGLPATLTPSDRIITVGDCPPEIGNWPHVVKLTGRGRVTDADLINNARRMRPDYLLLDGELI